MLYSNRSAALLSLSRLPLALNDAKRAVELDPTWTKGYRRKASVLDTMKRYREALAVYEEALAVAAKDPTLAEEARRRDEIEIRKLMAGGWFASLPEVEAGRWRGRGGGGGGGG